MASKLLGRAPCPECDFPHAHVKINTEKPTAKAYRHCPECGAQYFPRNAGQADTLMAKIKPAKIDDAAPAPAPAPAPPPAAKAPPTGYRVVLGVRVPTDEVTA